MRPPFTLAVIAVAMTLLHVAKPVRLNFGLPGFNAEFSSNFGGFTGFGGSSSSSSSSAQSGQLPSPAYQPFPSSNLPFGSSFATSFFGSDYGVGATNQRGWLPVDISVGGARQFVDNTPLPAGEVVERGALPSSGNEAGGFAAWTNIPFAGSFKATSNGPDTTVGDKVVFDLYTRETSSSERLTIRDKRSLKESSFSAKRPTKLIVHGYLANARSGSGPDYLKDAILKAADLNVILVDWSKADLLLYPVDALSAVPQVGAKIAEMVQALVNEKGADEGDMHIIGHSLGAHIVGVAGSIALGPKGKGWVTGLDPAGPMFEGTDPSVRLDETDAEFVEAVHTDSGYLGIVQLVGHIDYFVDGGRHRHPHCGEDALGICTHCFAYEVYAQAIEGSLVGTKCESQESQLRGDCTNNEKSTMGLKTRSRGTFFVDSNVGPSDILMKFGIGLLPGIFNSVVRRLMPNEWTSAYLRC